MSTRPPTLILGGTGKTGSRVANRLRARGVPVRIGSRSNDPPFDWTNRETWSPALTGTESLYISYYPELALPGAADDIRHLTQLVASHGVRRVVLLSGRGEPHVAPSVEAVRACGAAFTIIEAAFFDQNFSEGAMREEVLHGEVAFPAGGVAEPFVDADDIADVAVAALTEDGHAGKTYELTGPRLLTFADAMAEIASATGREVRYTPCSPEAYGDALAAFVPRDVASFLSKLFAGLLDGHNAHVTDGVERALGRRPRDFRDFARSAARAGVWNDRGLARASR